MVNIQPTNTDDLHGITIWYNGKLANHILPRWTRNGVYKLNDLLSANVEMFESDVFGCPLQVP